MLPDDRLLAAPIPESVYKLIGKYRGCNVLTQYAALELYLDRVLFTTYQDLIDACKEFNLYMINVHKSWLLGGMHRDALTARPTLDLIDDVYKQILSRVCPERSNEYSNIVDRHIYKPDEELPDGVCYGVSLPNEYLGRAHVVTVDIWNKSGTLIFGQRNRKGSPNNMIAAYKVNTGVVV